MVKRMLIDATHPEETRVVVLNGNRIEEFDFETSTKKQLKGNIYLAKVTRVEPSLQAAFVEYGGNRHGFLAFSEIHPDYWRIPVADREALLAAQKAEDDEESIDEPRPLGREDMDEGATPTPSDDGGTDADISPSPELAETAPSAASESTEEPTDSAAAADSGSDDRAAPLEHRPWFTVGAAPQEMHESIGVPGPAEAEHEPAGHSAAAATAESTETAARPDEAASDLAQEPSPIRAAEDETASAETPQGDAVSAADDVVSAADAVETIEASETQSVESVGGDDADVEAVETRKRFRPLRHYKIQEVIKRRQVLLVQVVKEERGNKGAALTTYLSLAGRYCVLMPNTARGGGISRRITNAQDRKRLKAIMEELQVPEGMAVILRTAGMERTKAEIKRDYEYLLRQWDEIRETTLKSTAPSLVYEEGNLIKRAIRDLYTRDIDEILVEGEAGYRAAKAFMKTLMPSHVDRIQLYNDPSVPLFQRFQVESQLEEIHAPTVRLKSGGYIVINPTEALVSIDVNSGRATRERHIEETAFKTNLEAADEIARQLRLRDLAGLIVIDFIDMEDPRNQHAVERRLKEAMKSDRARIQIGRISPFGLLELSRQRLRPSLLEVSSERCPHCAGTGFVRSTESAALHVLRAIEEEGVKLRTLEAVVHVPTNVALYVLNQKREALAGIESRFGLRATFSRDDTLIPPAYRLERVRTRAAGEPLPGQTSLPAPAADVEAAGETEPVHEIDETSAADVGAAGAGDAPAEAARDAGDGDGHRRRRRRRRRRGRGGEERSAEAVHAESADAETPSHEVPAATSEDVSQADGEVEAEAAEPEQAATNHGEHGTGDGPQRRRRRGRRGGRRRGRRGLEGQPAEGHDDPFADPRHRQPEEIAQDHAPSKESNEERPWPRPVEGPGDAYDWPWNRRAERFPEEQRDEHERQAQREESVVTEAPRPLPEHQAEPVPAESQSEPRAAESPAPENMPAVETGAAESPAPESVPAVETSAPETTRPSDEPPSPPRRGWWRRLTR
ncbi:MAG TPA: Rne/Rng family ribonuclease [Alphaproteobacteria bacterium]